VEFFRNEQLQISGLKFKDVSRLRNMLCVKIKQECHCSFSRNNSLNHSSHLSQLHQSRGIPGTKPLYHIAAVVTNRIGAYEELFGYFFSIIISGNQF
jgi:hypothetical protein